MQAILYRVQSSYSQRGACLPMCALLLFCTKYSRAVLRVVLASPRVLFYTKCSRVVFSAWCLLAHEGSSVLIIRAVFRKVLVRPRVLFCTECSRAFFAWRLLAHACSFEPSAVELFSAWCWPAHGCSSVPSASGFYPRGAGHPMCALLYLVQSSCSPRGAC